jgi:p-cumate 2,3-dioxygenase subunit beta
VISTPNRVSRQDVEEFLFNEAALLDELKLDEWLKLFLDDANYLVPPLDAREASQQDALYLVADDMQRLRSRVSQYQGRAMWVENPPSRTRRIISNVRILSADAGEVRVGANFVVYRVRAEVVDAYVGRYEHVLATSTGALRFRERKAILDLEALRPHGKVSIIL